MGAGQGSRRGWNSSWHSHLLPLARITYLYVENHFLILPWEKRGGKREAFIPCHSERTLKTYLLCRFLQGACYRVLISATIYWLLEEEKKTSWTTVLPSSSQPWISHQVILFSFPFSVCNVKAYIIHTYTAKVSLRAMNILVSRTRIVEGSLDPV